MSFRYINLLPNDFLNTSGDNLASRGNNNTVNAVNLQPIEIPMNEFELRLQELLVQRTNLLEPIGVNIGNPIEGNVGTSTTNQIPTTEVLKFCNEYKENKQKQKTIGLAMKVLNENKEKIEGSYNIILENLRILFEFVKINDEIRALYNEIVNNVADLAAKSKEVVCKNENLLIEEQTKLSNYISECVELFSIVEKEKEKLIDKTNNDDKVSITCPICYERNVNSVYVPCGHTICNICNSNLLSHSCIICRKKAKSMPFYLSN